MSSSSAAHLPVEIWRQIADHMSTKAWARVSGTCKAMHYVQPKQISIGVSSESALAWVQTHWGQASTLKLNWHEGIPWIMAHNAASLTSLKRVELRLFEEGWPTTATVLTWLLAQATQLQLLVVHRPTALVVPPLCNLSHLIMASSDMTATTTAFRQLHNLQTLWLDITSPDQDNACADLDLASMLQLSDACIDLRDGSPDYIHLPRHCRLHLFGEDKGMFTGTVLKDIAKHGQLRSIDLHVTLHELVEDSLPFLVEWNCSSLEWWAITHLGVASRPVEFQAAHFCCLTHLKLTGKEVHIRLPQEPALQVLDVDAECLSIMCTNAQEQAKGLQQLRVVYRTLQNTDVFLLVGTMCGLGATVRKMGVMEARTYLNGRHGLLVSYRHEPVIWKCPCGACLNCLRHI